MDIVFHVRSVAQGCTQTRGFAEIGNCLDAEVVNWSCTLLPCVKAVVIGIAGMGTIVLPLDTAPCQETDVSCEAVTGNTMWHTLVHKQLTVLGRKGTPHSTSFLNHH